MTPKQPCRNHPEKWANDRGNLCRACLREQGDTRTTRQIQADERSRTADAYVARVLRENAWSLYE